MKNLSADIEIAIKDAISGMNLDINILDVDDDKLARLMNSRLESFSATKEMIKLWQESPNAPSQAKLRKNAEELIKSGENSIEVLRQALRKKISFSELDSEKYGTAIKSKPVIYKAINEINAGVISMKLQLDADELDFKEREFRRSFPEKFANQEFYPEKDYYKEWHDKQTDSVIICPLGTKGKVITLDGLNIMLPAIPKAKKNILFSNLPKEEQYWRRIEPPKGLTPENEDMYYDFILEEFRRRREGVFFMNNGEIVYLTPAHYMALQWVKMLDTGGFMDFRYAQAEMFYFTRACVVDPRCLGELFVKSRRTGFTYQILCEMINDGTATANVKLGMISKTGDDAQEAFLKMTYGIQNLPFFFVPVIKGKIDSKTEVEFAKPSDSSKVAKKKKDNQTDDYLNTLLNWKTTTESAYDGQRMYRLLIDEASKPLPPFSLETYWGRVSPTINNGGRIVGKIYVGSTVNPMAKGGSAFLKMYKGSIVSKRDEATKRTATGLYAYFLPAHKNMEAFTDKYGVCHTVVEQGKSFFNVYNVEMFEGSIQYLENVRKQKRKQSDILYNEELRANPMTVEEAFRDEAKGSMFNLEKINDQIAYNESQDIEEKELIRGNFQWKDGVKDSVVEWHPNPKGRFLLGWIPEKAMQNKWETRTNAFGGRSKHPCNDDLGCLGVDSYDIDSTNDSKLDNTENGMEWSGGSKGAISGVTSFFTLKNVPSHSFFLEYVARPETAEIFFEDVLMACVFYSMPVLIENNKARLLYHFYNRGFRGFCLSRFDKPSNRLNHTEKMLGGIPSNSADVIQMHYTAIEAYVEKYVGFYTQGDEQIPVREENEIGNMPFNRTLRDWSTFNVSNRTKSDITIASGYALLGVNRHTYKFQAEVSNEIKFKIRTF
jgi:hypothetical protein